MPKRTLYVCPSPDCEHVESEVPRMTEHINGEHRGEWQNEDWPDPTLPESAEGADDE